MGYLVGAVVAVIAFLAVRRAAILKRDRARTQLDAELRAIAITGQAEAQREKSELEGKVREERLAVAQKVLTDSAEKAKAVARREDELAKRAAVVAAEKGRLAAREQAITEREQALRKFDDRKRSFDQRREEMAKEMRAVLERGAGETTAEVRERLVNEWLEEARAEGEERVRRVEQNPETDYAREAKRLMGLAIQRYQGHYLTERLLSNIHLLPGVADRVAGPSDANLVVIEGIANIKMQMAEDRMSVRLEGQDSFGREIARRAIARFGKHGVQPDAVERETTKIRDDLEREVFDLGKRAFRELDIPRAHPDIVKLVGRLNWRTSYTQNQWKHAVEAAFLCGMIAAELGLDVKIARRAALMHDIGKALTHTIDGSHAVIGADYARRLGESELVANAIGAHHADEPCNSVYASLVAACDAMSGARPGARREQSDNYVQRREELERIGRSYQGVNEAFAVQGGREIRVYVSEKRVSDERAVELSTEIAKQISDELTFPGQIKVTVIRETRVEEIAG